MRCLSDIAMEGSMSETYLVAIDLGRRHFQVCATDASGGQCDRSQLNNAKRSLSYASGEGRLGKTGSDV